MKTFTLHLQSSTQYERFDDAVVFAGADASGAFSLRAAHERMITALRFGIAHFRLRDGETHYLALPGGVLYFAANDLFLSTRRYIRDSDYKRLGVLLREQLEAEETALGNIKHSLRTMDENMLRRFWQMGRQHGGLS